MRTHFFPAFIRGFWKFLNVIMNKNKGKEDAVCGKINEVSKRSSLI